MRVMGTITRWTAVALPCALVLGLAACAPEPMEEEKPAPSTAQTPTQTPTPAPTAEPTADPRTDLPACEEFTEVSEYMSSFQVDEESSDGAIAWMDALGPEALATFEAAESKRTCLWGAVHNNLGGLAAVLDDDARETLVHALEASDYVAADDPDDASFGWAPEGGIEQGASPVLWQSFVGDVWIASQDGDRLGREMVAALTELRPELVG